MKYIKRGNDDEMKSTNRKPRGDELVGDRVDLEVGGHEVVYVLAGEGEDLAGNQKS